MAFNQTYSLKNSTLSFFLKNFVPLFSGNVSGQLVIILSSPILSRLYSPESFGLLELILSLFTVFAVFSNWKFDNAIVVQKNHQEAYKLFSLCFIINNAMFMLSLGCTWLLKYNDVYFFSQTLSSWWWAPSLLAWLSGCQQTIQMFFIREKKYNIIAIVIFAQALGLVSLQIFLGYLVNYSPSALILGYIMNNIIVCFLLAFTFFRSRKPGPLIQVSHFYSKFSECKSFLFYTVPTSLLGAISQRSLFIMMGIFFTETDVGFAGLAMRVMFLPLTLITRSMSQLFFGIFSEKKEEHDFPQQINKILRLKMIIISLTIPAIFHAPQIFEFCFGKQWTESGYYVMLLSPAAFMLFLTAWLDRTHDVASQQKKALYLEISYDILLIIGMTFISYFYKSPFYLVAFFGFFTATYNLVWLALTVKLIGISYKTSFENLLFLIACILWSTCIYMFIQKFSPHFILTLTLYCVFNAASLVIVKRYKDASRTLGK
jgi:lipopolysaccharide exporter